MNARLVNKYHVIYLLNFTDRRNKASNEIFLQKISHFFASFGGYI